MWAPIENVEIEKCLRQDENTSEGSIKCGPRFVFTWHQPSPRSWQEHTPTMPGIQKRHKYCSTRQWPWCRPRGAVSCWCWRWWWTWRATWWLWAPPWPGQTCGPARRTSMRHRLSWRWGCRWWRRSRRAEIWHFNHLQHLQYYWPEPTCLLNIISTERQLYSPVAVSTSHWNGKYWIILCPPVSRFIILLFLQSELSSLYQVIIIKAVGGCQKKIENKDSKFQGLVLKNTQFILILVALAFTVNLN